MPLTTDSHGRSVVPIVINNKEDPIDTSRVFPVTSSSTGDVVHYFAGADTAICDRACNAAWEAFRDWRKAPVARRRNLMLKVAELFEQRVDELVEAQIKETSCAGPWAKNNVLTATNYIREFAACISSVKGVIPPTDKPDTMTFVYKEAIGPILVIPPWNAAVILSARAISSAIVTGCTVVLKASELSPLTHSIISDIFREAGCPPGVLNTLQTRREDAAAVTETLIANERIRKIEFIGSAAVGRIIGATAAKYLKPVLMELGGKCPAIVLDDADLPKAATLCAQGATLHHGQICFGTERIIVLRKVADDFIELLVEQFKAARGGTAVNEKIAHNALSILQDAKEKGAKFLYGEAEYAGKNAVKPALVQIDPKMSNDQLRIIDEETVRKPKVQAPCVVSCICQFGPSASVYIVEDGEQAIEVANRSAYGLNATIHTQNLERAIKVGRELEAGQVHCNSSSVYISPTGPQGGVKGSGFGRQNASWGLEEFYVEKQISWHGKNSG